MRNASWTKEKKKKTEHNDRTAIASPIAESVQQKAKEEEAHHMKEEVDACVCEFVCVCGCWCVCVCVCVCVGGWVGGFDHGAGGWGGGGGFATAEA